MYSATGATLDAHSNEREQLAALAYDLGRKYGDRRYDDAEAAAAQWRDLAGTGLTGLSIPEEYGGGGGLLDLCIVSERLAAGGFPSGRLVLTTAVVGSMLARHGSPEQKERYLPSIAAGDTVFAFAITEPDAGSNAFNMSTTVRESGGSLFLSGQKTYISGVESAHALAVVARLSPGKLGVVIVPLPDEGIAMTEVAVGLRLPEKQWTLYFDDLELPASALIREAEGSPPAFFDGLNPERLTVAAEAVGTGRWCLERAVRYANDRVVFTDPIGTNQAIAHPLAEAHVLLEGAWQLTLRAAGAYDAGSQAGVEADIAKIAATDAAWMAADRALQTFGGSGFTDEALVLDRFLHMRLLRSIPVSRELALNHVATSGLGLPRLRRPAARAETSGPTAASTSDRAQAAASSEAP
jgi:alkylation response protein AidB-like acyl-CoA dehydrogenase